MSKKAYFFGGLGCSGLLGLVLGGFELGVEELGLEFMSDELLLDPLPETFTLSTTLRLPAKDWAIRLASSLSFCEGAVPLRVTESESTSTAMLLLVSVGSLWKAVLMSFLI